MRRGSLFGFPALIQSANFQDKVQATWGPQTPTQEQIARLKSLCPTDSVENRLLKSRYRPVLCWSCVGRSDLDVVGEFTKLSRQILCALDEQLWFVFDTLFDVADALMKNLPYETA